MLQNTEIGLGLYSDRAYKIIDILISTYKNAGRTSHYAYCTLKCTKIATRPNGEVVLKVGANGNPSWIARSSAWNNMETARQARRKLAEMLKYVAMYKLNAGYTRAADRQTFKFKWGSEPSFMVTEAELRTLRDLVSGRRPRNPEYAEALVGSPRDEVETGLEAARRAEAETFRAKINEKLDLAKKKRDDKRGKAQIEHIRKQHELSDWWDAVIKKCDDEYEAESAAIKAELSAGLAEIEKKYSAGA